MSNEDLDPLLHVQDVIASGSLFLQNALPLKSIIESTRISENALQLLEKTIDTLGDVSSTQCIGFQKLINRLKAHPLAKAVLTALSIPCKVCYSSMNSNALRNRHLCFSYLVVKERA